MARAGLGWSLSQLAQKAGVNLNTISRFESGRQVLSGTVDAIEDTLRAAGVTFIPEDDSGGPGVRLPKVRVDAVKSRKSTKRSQKPLSK
jgi:transcriptional regulator with XRE-family HTH domain